MYNVLIVDDELFVRIGIKSSIDWTANGFNEPFLASNGREAWDIILSNEIHVVLTDIKMPEMGGIELIKKIRESNIMAEVIVLSSYNDYEYIRGAMQLGACDYLFKPTMMPDDIKNTVCKVIEKIEGTMNSHKTIKTLERKVENTLQQVKQKFILEIIYGRLMDTSLFNKESKELNIMFRPYNLVVLVVKVDKIDPLIKDVFNGDEYLLQFAIMNIISEVLSSYDALEAICKNTDEYLIIFSNENDNPVNKINEMCLEMAHKVIEELQNYLKLAVSAGVSKCHNSISTLKTAYDEACLSVEKRFFLGGGSIIFYESSVQENNVNNLEVSHLMAEVAEMDESEYKDKICSIFSKIKSSKYIHIKDVMEISSNIVSSLLRNVSRFEGVVEELYNMEQEIYSKIYKSSSIAEIESLILRLAQNIDEVLKQKYRNQISQAIKLMEKYLGDSQMSLESVAAHVNVSRSYFSRLFKETTGKSFIEYLTELRVEKARELYKTTDLKVYEIAELIGYADWRYFCKVYKKYTGQSLSSLRR